MLVTVSHKVSIIKLDLENKRAIHGVYSSIVIIRGLLIGYALSSHVSNVRALGLLASVDQPQEDQRKFS